MVILLGQLPKNPSSTYLFWLIEAVTESRRLVEALVRSSKHPGVLAEAHGALEKKWYLFQDITFFPTKCELSIGIFFQEKKLLLFVKKKEGTWLFPVVKITYFCWWEFSTTRWFKLQAIDLRSGEQWGNTPCTSALYLDSNVYVSNVPIWNLMNKGGEGWNWREPWNSKGFFWIWFPVGWNLKIVTMIKLILLGSQRTHSPGTQKMLSQGFLFWELRCACLGLGERFDLPKNSPTCGHLDYLVCHIN